MILKIKQALPWLLVLFIALVAVGLTRFSTIYVDEFDYKIFLERFFIDGGFKISVTPFCSEGFLVRPSLLLIPAAAFWSMISWLGSDWLSYRVVPYVGLVAIYVILIAHNLRRGSRDFWPLLLLVITGPVLYGLTILRAEIPILSICLIIYVLAQYILSSQKVIPLYVCSFLMLLFFSLVVYVHPKALYLILILVVSFVMAALNLKGKIRRTFYSAVFIVAALLITHAALDLQKKQFLSCGSVSTISEKLGKQAVNPLDLLEAPKRFKEDVILAVLDHMSTETFNNVWFRTGYRNGYLPDVKISGFTNLANALIETTIILFIIYILLKTIACVRFLEDSAERRQFYLVVSVMLSLFIPFIFCIFEDFYVSAFFVCSLMISAALLWPFKVDILWFFQIDQTKKDRFYVVVAVMLVLFIPAVFYFSYVFFIRRAMPSNFYSEFSYLMFSLMIVAASLSPFKNSFSKSSDIRYGKYKSFLISGFYCYMVIVSVYCLTLVYCNFTKVFLDGYEVNFNQSYKMDCKLRDEKIQQALSDASVPQRVPLIMDERTYDAVSKHPIVMWANILFLTSPEEIKSCLDKYHVQYGVIQSLGFYKLETMIPLKVLSKIEIKQQYKQFPGTDVFYLFKVKE